MMTVEEYAAATRKIRKLQSELAASEIKALEAYLDPVKASRLAQLRRQAAEDQRLGPTRLAAATKESRDYDKRKAAQKRQQDHDAKQRKDQTTQTRHQGAREEACCEEAQHGKETQRSAAACSATREPFEPVRTAPSAAA